MAKKKSINKSFIIDKYMDYLLVHGKNPPSPYMFAKENNFNESEFYQYFGSFDSIKKDIFLQFYSNTIDVLHKSEDYSDYDARTKLLSFYYTFFEILTANRSFVLCALQTERNSIKNTEVLATLKPAFIDYIKSLPIEKIDLKKEGFNQFQDKSLSESAWVQLLIILNFWMNDDSKSFEKTDIFIEKSLNTSFDLIDIKPIKSLIDFGKFVWKERINFSIR